jgi:hypothetical protein
MQVKFLDISGINDIYTFNKEVFPHRQKSENILDFWFSKNQSEHSLSVILQSDSGEILGQNLHSSMSYFFKKCYYNGEWGFDFIVKEEIRKEGYGIDILAFTLKKKKNPLFAAGSGPMALKLELKMGYSLLGDLKKYVGFINPVYVVASAFRGIIKMKRFPNSVKLEGVTFKRICKENLIDPKEPFNDNLLEFGRDRLFMNWRFFSNLHEYALYILEGEDTYFVLRTISRNYLTCLVLVDYRCDFSKPEGFELILRAVKKTASKLGLGVIITGSSLRVCDAILENNHFRTIGYKRPIISTESFNEDQKRIDAREFILTTLADSDGEILW